MTNFGNLYLGNKMVGIQQFNYPWFDSTAERLRKVPGVISVFNPADRDRESGFYPAPDCMGTVEDMAALNFSRREALRLDWTWIAENSDGMLAGPLWYRSSGTISEIACHQALGLPVWSTATFFAGASEGPGGELFHPEELFQPIYQLDRLVS